MNYKSIEAFENTHPDPPEEVGIHFKLTLVISGKLYIEQRVPYEVFLHTIRHRTLIIKRLIAKHFTDEEWEDIENRVIPKARQWMSRGTHSVEISIPDLFLWNRIGQFIAECGKIQGWLK